MMETYHIAWLGAHPERSKEWLKERLADGFHVHHMDGDHSNDDPKNLVLIESGDHMMIHNGVSRLLWRPQTKKGTGRPKKIVQSIDEIRSKLEEAEAILAKKLEKERKIKLRDSGRAKLASNRAKAMYQADIAAANAVNQLQ